MEQRDYILREIEKIGLIMRTILNKLIGKKNNQETITKKQFKEEKDLLLGETGFDLDLFLASDETESLEYIDRFKGLNTQNLEILAEIIYQYAEEDIENNRPLLEKALAIYILCNVKDMTYSFSRELKISLIKDILNDL